MIGICARFLLSLPRFTLRLFVVSGILFVTGAIGFELISFSFATTHGFDTLTYRLLYAIEEILEMVGVALFIFALLDYIVVNFSELTVVVRAGDAVQLDGERETSSSVPESRP